MEIVEVHVVGPRTVCHASHVRLLRCPTARCCKLAQRECTGTLVLGLFFPSRPAFSSAPDGDVWAGQGIRSFPRSTVVEKPSGLEMVEQIHCADGNRDRGRQLGP